MQPVFISRLHFPVTTLGPGNRIGIWFQGCSIRCKGCVSSDTWHAGTGSTTLEEVIEQVQSWASLADGVTITGGEPFEQPSALTKLLKWLNAEFNGNVLVYSGYPVEKIQTTLDDVHGCIDALISEPFEHDVSDDLPLRGSDNQILHYLTDRGRALFSEYEKPTLEPSMDAMFDDDGVVWFCGIPKRHDLSRLQEILQSKGHNAVFSAQVVKPEK